MNTIISSDIEKAVNVLRNGGVILFPTETVYGIGADARNLLACERIYQIKNRPRDNPFIVHVDSIESMGQIAKIPNQYKDSISHFSPGPITFILDKTDDSVFSSGLSTIGVRVPSNQIAQNLLAISKIPIAAPSANISGRPSITRTTDAISEFSGKVDLILTGEDSEIGIESTVLNLTGEIPYLLRPGRISFLELRKYIPNLQKFEMGKVEQNTTPASPGMKYRHYAPDCEVILWDKNDSLEGESTALISFQTHPKADYCVKINTNLEYMHHLYSFFIDCDKKKIQKAYCEFPLHDEFEEVLLNRIEKAIMK